MKFDNQKGLDKKYAFPMFPLPSFATLCQAQSGASEALEKLRSFTKLFSDKFGKSIDGAKCECSLRNLSPRKGWFFEIYFVRLIGTPNQHIPS